MNEMSYSFHFYPDGETCNHCGSSIHSGWIVNGVVLGPECGKVHLRRLGVTWPENYGPGSFDRTAIKAAVDLYKRVMHQTYSNRVSTKEVGAMERIIGRYGWKIVRGTVSGSIMMLTTPEAHMVYQLVMENLKEA